MKAKIVMIDCDDCGKHLAKASSTRAALRDVKLDGGRVGKQHYCADCAKKFKA